LQTASSGDNKYPIIDYDWEKYWSILAQPFEEDWLSANPDIEKRKLLSKMNTYDIKFTIK